MMKKIIALTIVAILTLTTAAFAATYIDRDHDLTFEYDEKLFEITMEDETDDELLVILSGKEKAWGEDTYVRIHLADLDDGEKFPTLADFAEIEAANGCKVTQGEWNGFKDVFMYDTTAGDLSEYVFIVPVYDDDDHEVDDILTINIGITNIEDESAAMQRDDAISEIVDTLKVLDD